MSEFGEILTSRQVRELVFSKSMLKIPSFFFLREKVRQKLKQVLNLKTKNEHVTPFLVSSTCMQWYSYLHATLITAHTLSQF